MLDAGVAREVARGVLPVNTFSTMYATCNARSLMSFLVCGPRTTNRTSPSYPQREIEMVAEKMEAGGRDSCPSPTHVSSRTGGSVRSAGAFLAGWSAAPQQHPTRHEPAADKPEV